MKKGLKSSGDDSGKGSGAPASKLLGKKDKKQKQQNISDIGVIENEKDNKDGKEHNDSFEKYYNKDLDLDEDQVPVVIYELNESAINFISQESFEKALILLQKAQTMLEQIQASKNQHDKFVFLLTMHNMALCYQKLGVLEECALSLEQCLNYLQSEFVQDFFNDPSQPSLKLKMLKYKCKTHMQICALLSQVHKHKDAALHANQAIKIAHFLIHDSESLCSYYTKELIQKKPLEEVSLISNFNFSLLEKTAVKLLPVFQTILKRIALEDDVKDSEGGVPVTGPLPKDHHSMQRSSIGSSLNPANIVKLAQEKANSRLGSGMSINVGDADMKNILGYLNQNEWIYSLNIGNIMQIAPLTLQDFMSSTAIQIELSREFVLEKLCFLAVSYFCMGTEFRFLHQLNETIGGVKFQRKDSEYWHGKAVELAISFLPSESPLVSHILMSYEKHHSPSNMAIPEDETQDVKVRVVRQITGVDSNRLQPIIRFHPDSDYRVQFIQLQPLDYYQIFGKNQPTSMSHHQRRRNFDGKKAQSLNSQAAAQKTQQKRPSSKTPSQPLTSKTGQSKHIVFGMNVPQTTSTAGGMTQGLPSGQGGETISSDGEDAEFITENLPNTLVEDVTGENDPDQIIEEHKDRSHHAKKHRRQLLSPPAASGSGVYVNGIGVPDVRSHGGDKDFLKMEDQKSLTQKKAKRLLQNNQAKNGTQEFKTLSQHLRQRKSDGLADAEDEESLEEEPRGGTGSRKERQHQAFDEIEIQGAKDRQRSSELGISNKYHRRLQTSIIKQSMGQEGQLADLTVQKHVLSDPEQNEQQQLFHQERRARSSLSNRNHSSHGKRNVQQQAKGPAVSGAIAQTSQIMATAALEANLNTNLGLNSSQPIIIPSKGQHNLDLNTNLRQVSKNRSLINDSLNNQQNQFNSHQIQGSFTLDNTTGNQGDPNNASLTNNGDRIQSRSQGKRSSSQNQNLPPGPANHQQMDNSQQQMLFERQKQSSSSRRFKNQSNTQASAEDQQQLDIQREVNKNRMAARNASSHQNQQQLDLLNTTTSAPLTHANTSTTAQNEKINHKSGRQLSNQKGAAPITDIRAKRQAATLNVEDLPGNQNGVQNNTVNQTQQMITQSSIGAGTTAASQFTNQQLNQIQRNNKKFVELATKANSSMLASQQQHQQMLLNQFAQSQQQKGNAGKIHQEVKDSFEQPILSQGANNVANPMAGRASSQQVAHTGSRSSKNSLGMSNLASIGGQPSKQPPTSSSAKQRKTSKGQKAAANNAATMYASATNQVNQANQQAGANPQGLTSDQLIYIMQAKREKFNNSALVSGTRDQLDAFANQALMNPASNQQMINLNKVYQQNKRTPTSLAGQSQENIIHANINNFNSTQPMTGQLKSTQKSSKDKNLKNHQALLNQHLQEGGTGLKKEQAISMGHHMHFQSNPSGSSTGKAAGASHLHQRGNSQLAAPSNQMMFMDQSATAHQTVAQMNRKSSIEAKIGGQAAVSGVVKDLSALNNSQIASGQIRSKAQYDNWLQLQVMKKATGSGQANAPNIRQGGSQSVQGQPMVSQGKGRR